MKRGGKKKAAVKKSKVIPENDLRDEAAFAKERERVAKLVAEGGLYGGILKAQGLSSDVVREIWRQVIISEKWSVTKAMAMASGVGGEIGIPEVALVLRRDNSLWREWWLRDFPDMERDLLYTVRGVPDWIKSIQNTDYDRDAAGVIDQYYDVPWRRLYVWFTFFERRLAKYLINKIRQRIDQWERDNIRGLATPFGVQVAVYTPHFTLSNISETLRISQRVHVVTPSMYPDKGDLFQSFRTLPYLVFGEQDIPTRTDIVSTVWHLIQPKLRATNEDLTLREDWRRHITQSFNKNQPSGQVWTGDNNKPTVYNFFKKGQNYGRSMFQFLVHYIWDMSRPLLSREFDAEIVSRALGRKIETYDQYLKFHTMSLADRLLPPNPVYERVLTDEIVATFEFPDLGALPMAPTRKSGQLRDGPSVLFVGQSATCIGCNSREAVHRCKQCKVASYCGKECQVAHWTDLHQYECTGERRTSN